MLDGNCLSAFVAIAEERSFSRAADKLGVTQSVVSKRLKRLEDQLGTQLVDRSIRPDIHLTRVGEIFLAEAVETLAQLRKAERSGRNLARGSSGPLRIGFVFSAAMNGTLTRILGGLRSEFPEMQFRPQLMETPEQLAALDAGRLDAALVRPRASYPRGCLASEVHSEGLVVCHALHHPLSGDGPLTPKQLAGECFFVPQFHESVGLIDSIRRLAQAGRFAMPQIVQTDDFVTAACLASTGDGIVLAPASLANLGIGGVRFRRMRGYEEHLKIILAYRIDAPAHAMRQALALFDDL